jgi:hypothetical protein
MPTKVRILPLAFMYNLNISHFYCLLRKEHLYQDRNFKGEYEKVTVFAAQSSPDRALLFTVMLDNGTIRSRVPVNKLCTIPCEAQPLDYLQLWDCFSINSTVISYDYLKGTRAKVIFKDKTSCWGNYMMTFDWYDNSFSDEPGQYKCLHMIELDNGNYALQPNNRIFWKHMSFTTKPFPENPDYKVDNKVYRCEDKSDRWILAGEDDNYYYDIEQDK